jgi:hypothetical protein
MRYWFRRRTWCNSYFLKGRGWIADHSKRSPWPFTRNLSWWTVTAFWPYSVALCLPSAARVMQRWLETMHGFGTCNIPSATSLRGPRRACACPKWHFGSGSARSSIFAGKSCRQWSWRADTPASALPMDPDGTTWVAIGLKTIHSCIDYGFDEVGKKSHKLKKWRERIIWNTQIQQWKKVEIHCEQQTGVIIISQVKQSTSSRWPSWYPP